MEASDATKIEAICPNCKEKILINIPTEDEVICEKCGKTIHIEITAE